MSTSSNPLLTLMREQSDGDPWGTAMNWTSQLCDALTVTGESHLIPVGLKYRPSILLRSDTLEPEAQEIVAELENPPSGTYIPGFTYTVEDVAFALRVLDRYIDWLTAAGKDY